LEVAITIAILAVVVGVFVLIWYLDTRRARERTAALKAVAGELGFDFHPAGDSALLARVQQFGLGGKGSIPRLSNLLRGKANGLDCAVFDFEYTVGQGTALSDPGQQPQATAQTVIAIQSPDLNLPAFVLGPTRYWHALGALLGMQDLNFESHPVFSKKYVLKAVDEAAVRRLFDRPTLDHFEQAGDITVEGAGDAFLLYCEGQVIDAKDVSATLKQGFETLAVLRKRV
jgi:hypothetical protein